MSEHAPPGSTQRAGPGPFDVYSPEVTPPSSGKQPSRARSAIGVIVVSLALIGGAGFTVFHLSKAHAASLQHDQKLLIANADLGAVVRTTVVSESPSTRTIELLGEARPFASVTLYAKVSGYLQTINVDVGDHVKAGQVVATIESPETDRALAGAKADYDNKQATANRVDQLLDKKYVSPQEDEQAKTDAVVAQDKVAGLTEQQAYETLKAPFAGTVTARFADPGALMQSAASSQTSALPVVTVSQTDSLRVMIYLDQEDAASVRAGTRVDITMAERPGVHVGGSVTRATGELDPKTRKMLVEVDLNDRNGIIVPGSFVQVDVDAPTASMPQASASALTVRKGQTLVAVVSADSTVHFRPVTVASNDGHTVIFSKGVAVGEHLALDVGSGIADGAKVRVTDAAALVPAGSASGQQHQ